jgi:hypothetical protein
MNNNARNALVHHALEILKMSTLEALYKQSSSAYFVKPHVQELEIRQYLGIPKIKPKDVREGSHLILGILQYLEADGYAKCLENGRWRITEKGMSAIETERT